MLTRDERREGRDEQGFTLIELLVAIGVFSVIMAIVTTGVISVLRTVRATDAASARQAQQQNAIVWIGRLLRYADNPAEGFQPTPWVAAGNAKVDAKQNADLTFTTYSGTGSRDRVAYWVRLYVDAGGNLVSEVTTPQPLNDANKTECWFPSDSAACAAITANTSKRVLVQASASSSPTLTLAYQDASGATLNPPTTLVTNANYSADWATWSRNVAQILVTIGDTAGGRTVSQLVNLANPR